MSKKFLIWLGKILAGIIFGILARIAFAYAGYPVPDELGSDFIFGAVCASFSTWLFLRFDE